MKTILLSLLLLTVAMQGAFAQEDVTIRKELESQYQKLAEAHDRKDLKAIANLKTADFHTIGPDGKVSDVKTMEQYTKQFLETNKPPFHIRNTIEKLAVSENRLIAVADVFQEVSRTRELAGRIRKVDTSVRQRETWSRTPQGWKLKCVDNVHDQRRYVDGKRVDPTKPYDPDAAPFEPDTTASP